MKLSDIAFYLTTPVLITIIVISGYYVFANLFIGNLITPAVVVNDQSVSLSLDSGLEEALIEEAYKTIPSETKVKLGDQEFDLFITKSDLVVQNLEEIKGFGSGQDVTKVLSDGVKWVSGENVRADIRIDSNILLSKLDFSLGSSDGAFLNGDKLTGCESNSFNLEPDSIKISSLISAQLGREVIELSMEDLVVDSGQVWIIEECKRANNLLSDIQEGLSNAGVDGLDLEYVVNTGWVLSDLVQATSVLSKKASVEKVSPNEGEYKIMNGTIAMFKKYRYGSTLNVQSSVGILNRWLLKPSSDIKLAYDQVPPEVLKRGLKILDFTKVLAVGKTRLDLIRNGGYNWVIDYAEYGVEDMHMRIIQPGKTFSFINAIRPQGGGWMASGKPIGVGICNSSTTLFRAAIEAGFPIRDRSPHTVAIGSYEWGYPKNVVDAVYLTEPKVDTKFVNDLDYPVILIAEIERNEKTGWQYHSIYVRTSSEAPERKVELYDFKTWNHISPHRFEGHFRRKVYDDGKLVRTNKFYSDYRQGPA